MMPLYSILKFIFYIPIRIFFRIKVYGKENIPATGPFVICCNHTSISDMLILGVICKRQIHFMAKDEIFKGKLLTWFFKSMGAFPVNRKSADKSAITNSQKIIKEGKVLGIFPEGTRNPSGPPKKAKAGAVMIAVSTGAKIIPCAIYKSRPKVHIFQKVTLRIGEPIIFEEAIENALDKSTLRKGSEMLTEKITALWEKKH